jgi:hypothetical protein
VRVGRVPRSQGGPDAPLTDEALLAKFLANSDGRDDLARAVLALGTEKSVTAASLARSVPRSAA